MVQNFAEEETEESLNNDQWTGKRKPFSVGLQVAEEDYVGKSKDDSALFCVSYCVCLRYSFGTIYSGNYYFFFV